MGQSLKRRRRAAASVDGLPRIALMAVGKGELALEGGVLLAETVDFGA
jgi:hypothetical protein